MRSPSALPYGVLRFDPTGRRHLFVCDRPTARVPVGDVPATFDSWTVTGDAPENGSFGRKFQSSEHLLEALSEKLSKARVGLRVYAAGSESFLVEIARITDRYGLCAQEAAFEEPMDGAVPVLCIHCKTRFACETGAFATCPGCGRHLEVRTHFSRREGAYMGVAEPQAAAS